MNIYVERFPLIRIAREFHLSYATVLAAVEIQRDPGLQRDPRYAPRWEALKNWAFHNPERMADLVRQLTAAREIYRLQSMGLRDEEGRRVRW